MATTLKYIDKNTAYEDCLALQEALVADIVTHKQPETVLFCEHMPVYTAGSSASENDYLDNNDIPVVPIGRGGKHTYHGPGQRVVYPLLDLRERGRDLRAYIENLQNWLIASLKQVGLEAYSADDVGVWVKTPTGEAKIAAIGVRVRKWVTFHGIALNVEPDMSHFNGIVPCGIANKGVTSLKSLGIDISMADMDEILKEQFEQTFNCSFMAS